MNIGVIGTGHVGTTLATAFADQGHHVMLGSRDPSQAKLAEWTAGDRAHRSSGSERDAAAFGELVIIAIPGRALPKMLDDTGRDPWDGTIIFDVTNPFATDPEGKLVDAFGDDDSGSEYLQRELPNAAVVKALNEVVYTEMLHPEKSSVEAVRIAGNDDIAKQRVAEMLEGFGWRVRDLGSLSEARTLEHDAIARYS